ncbi:type III polyketide synthase [Gordonia hydrophobica]|uniref:3-oxoacyl-[acyl-carrier-protein] synthase III C-terminal domain-containing protein n=1 Tax=Gordonia hydrophobica TaxID=40516 RepID=A0ABZ2TZW2_9ACTN|nr:3-oxoacyl-[acyl-carrier-protein] synthase III C-terminal domain-containing protein [Gordonia hydrophobica]MBM7369528.1 alpha-pyrone synthase [Gordonia hydrophobica]
MTAPIDPAPTAPSTAVAPAVGPIIDEIPAPVTTVAVIEAVATGAPATVHPQTRAAEQVAELYDDPALQERIRRLYRNTRVQTRHLAVDPMTPEFQEFSSRPATVRTRMNDYFHHAVPLAVDVARRALAGVTDPATEIGQIIFVTSTGFIAPGVDVAVITELGLAPTVHRVIINFMGCAAAINGISTATDHVRANPDSRALLICLELSSVNAVFGADPVELVTHSLFGDGCGAMLIGASPVGRRLAPGQLVVRDTFSHLFHDTGDGIVLGVNDDGITCELAQELPSYIRRGVGPAIDAALNRSRLRRDDIAHWAIHPGGPAIIEQSVAALDLPPDRAATSWEVLAEYGNMLSVSLVFVLEKLIAAGAHGRGQAPETGVAFSFAPGVALEGMLFDLVC